MESIIECNEYSVLVIAEVIYKQNDCTGMETKNIWIDYGETFEEFMNEYLTIPGTLIEIWNPRSFIVSKHLIGDVNEFGGVCQCCQIISNDSIVLKYKMLVDENILAVEW